jgi:hypothetical protein
MMRAVNDGRTVRSETRRARAAVALAMSLGLCLSVCRLSSAQATQPSLTATAAQPQTRIQRWLDDLTDKQSDVRDKARTQLMGLSVDGLGELREAIDRSRPLSPAQAAELHDVVIHAYISANEPDRMPMMRKSGFLGVLLEPVQSGFDMNLVPAPGPGALPPDDNHIEGAAPAPDNQPEVVFRPPGGVLIKETWPGFAGFRFLRVGDVVVGTGGDQPTRAPTVQELRAAVQATAPGRSLDLQVLRQGRIVEIPVNVGPRPAWAEDEATTRQMQSRRLRRAEIYWQFAFAPLLLQDGRML